MKKALKFIVPGICILVVGITFYMIFDIQNKVEEKNYGTENIADNDEEIEEENITDSNTANVEDEEVENNTTEADNTVEDDNLMSEEDKSANSNQEKAINLVKEYWGEDSSVYFTNEGTNSKGEYIVAVRQKTSTTVDDYFKVNIETEEVEVDY